MTDLSNEQLSELVSQATENVLKETRSSKTEYDVEDFRSHDEKLGHTVKGSLWKISYDTSGAKAPQSE
jgi:ethanolamine utilization protein EutQ (cupin superfamily)